MADINAAFVIEDGLSFDNTQTGIFTGTNDPTAGSGEAAPVGSLFIRDDGTLYIKTGAADTDWRFVLRTGDISFDSLAPTTTKGDLIVRALGGNIRLAVGPDNYILTADASQPAGIKWAPFSGQSQITIDTGEPTGFVNRADSVISFSDSTRTFTIQPAAASFEVYRQGVKIVKTAVETVVLPNTSGLYFIFYQGPAATITASPTSWNVAEDIPISVVYWNSAQGRNVLLLDKRHGAVMDWATLRHLSRTRGTQFADGLSLNPPPGVTGTGTTSGEAQLSLTAGTIFSEDIEISIVDDATPAAPFEQPLSGPALIPMLYKMGAAPGTWYRDNATPFPIKIGSVAPVWNELSGGTWQLTEVGSAPTFITTWIAATSDLNQPVIGIVGQAAYSSLAQAQAAEEWQNIVLSQGLPFQELRPLWRIIYEARNSFTNAVRATIRHYQDLRATAFIADARPLQGDHGSLTGLADDDHPQYVHVDVPRTIVAQHQFAPAVAQPPFSLGTTAQGQLVSGLNADLLDGQDAAAFQPADADLSALAAINTVGFAVRTGTSTWATRSITGAPGNITVTNGSGVSTPVAIDLATTGVVPAIYGSSTQVPVLNVDSYGRITSASAASISYPVTSVFGRTGAITAAEGDYTLNQLGDVTLSSPAAGQVLRFTGSTWENQGLDTFADPGANGIVVRTALNATVARSIQAGTGISVVNGDGVSSNPVVINSGVTSLSGTPQQVNVSASTGSITLSTPQDISSTSSPTFAMVTVTGVPTAASHVATKQYVDNAITGLDVKPSVRAATTAPVTLSGLQVIDGVSLVAGDRVLVKNQAAAADNGIYVVSTGAWSRSADANESAEVTSGLYTFVEEGTVNGDSGWLLVTDNPIVVGTTALTFSQFTGTGQITAGDGLTKTGNTLNVGGTAGRITVNADSIDLSPVGTPGTYGQVTTDAYGRVTSGGINTVANGGTGLSTLGSGNQLLGVNSAGTGLEYKTLTAGSNITITHSPGQVVIASAGGGGAPGGLSSNIQFNDSGVFGGASTFNYIAGANARLEKRGTDLTTQAAFGLGNRAFSTAITDGSNNATVYIQNNGDTTSEGLRCHFRRTTAGSSGWITYDYDGSTPDIRLTDEDDDAPYVQFNVIGTGTFGAPLYNNVFGGRGPAGGATTGFGWWIGQNQDGATTKAGTPVMELDSQFLRLPTGTTAARPATPVNGMVRYNTDLSTVEAREANNWAQLTGVIAKSVISQTVTSAGGNYISETIPGGTLGTNRLLRIRAAGTWNNASGTTRSATMSITYGGIPMWTDSSPAIATGVTVGWHVDVILCANNSETAQKLNGLVHIGAATGVTAGVTGDLGTDEIVSVAVVAGTASADSTVDLALNFSVAFSGGGTINWIRYFYTIELL